MSYFYTSPTSNIPPQSHPSAIRMTRTGSSSSTTSTTSTASNSSSISIPSSRPGSSSASFCSSYWPSSSSTTCSSPSSYTNRSSHSRYNTNGTSYLPTPFRSALLHSSAASSPHNPHSQPSSYFSDDELLSLNLESVHLDRASTAPTIKHEMTTEEQVAAVREQVEREREREGGKNEPWWLQGVPAQQAAVVGMDKRSRVVRFAGETRRSSGQGKRRSVVGGKVSSRRD